MTIGKFSMDGKSSVKMVVHFATSKHKKIWFSGEENTGLLFKINFPTQEQPNMSWLYPTSTIYTRVNLVQKSGQKWNSCTLGYEIFTEKQDTFLLPEKHSMVVGKIPEVSNTITSTSALEDSRGNISGKCSRNKDFLWRRIWVVSNLSPDFRLR